MKSKIYKLDIPGKDKDSENKFSYFFIKSEGTKILFHMDYSEAKMSIKEVDELIDILKKVRKEAVKG